MEQQPEAKRARSDTAPAAAEPPSQPSPLLASLLEHGGDVAARAAYSAAAPFPHAQLHPLCDDARLRAVFAELQTLVGTLKETDLFKLHQTGDLGAMDAADGRCPQLLALRAALYGPPFRALVERLTGCGPLSPTPDCSCNVYSQGCGLLCHDDVIGTRRISYVIYLSEPDEGWCAADGGLLELYPLAGPATPAPAPTVLLLPRWNSMALFTVQPGVSFHAVQEVFGPSKLRASISGWFHAAADGGGGGGGGAAAAAAAAAAAGLSSRAQLMARAPPAAAAEGAGAGAPAWAEPPELSEPEAALLRAWVSPEYLETKAQAAVAAAFARDNSVRLASFLLPCRAAALAAAARAADGRDALGRGRPPAGYGVGVGAAGGAGGWELAGPPHKQRFLHLPDLRPAAAAAAAAADAAGGGGGVGCAGAVGPPDGCCAAAARLLTAAAAELVASPAFAKLLWRLCRARPTGLAALAARRFRPGLDYSLAHAGAAPLASPAGSLDCVLCVVDDGSGGGGGDGGGGGGGDDSDGGAAAAARRLADRAAWASGDVGGFECYLAQEEEEGEGGGGAAAGGGGGEGLRPSATGAGGRPDVYRARGGGGGGGGDDDDVLSVAAACNSLSLVHRDEGVARFVRYVSAAAPGSRWDVAAEFGIVLPDEGDDDDDDDDGDDDDDDDDNDDEEGGEDDGATAAAGAGAGAGASAAAAAE